MEAEAVEEANGGKDNEATKNTKPRIGKADKEGTHRTDTQTKGRQKGVYARQTRTTTYRKATGGQRHTHPPHRREAHGNDATIAKETSSRSETPSDNQTTCKANNKDGKAQKRVTKQMIFSDKDPRRPGRKGDDPLVIQGPIGDTRMHQIYIDTGSTVDIIYEEYF